MAGAMIRRLRLTRLDPDVVLGGGVFRTRERASTLGSAPAWRRHAPAAHVVPLLAPPVPARRSWVSMRSGSTASARPSEARSPTGTGANGAPRRHRPDRPALAAPAGGRLLVGRMALVHTGDIEEQCPVAVPPRPDDLALGRRLAPAFAVVGDVDVEDHRVAGAAARAPASAGASPFTAGYTGSEVSPLVPRGPIPAAF